MDEYFGDILEILGQMDILLYFYSFNFLQGMRTF